jgi:hypothetical protein
MVVRRRKKSSREDEEEVLAASTRVDYLLDQAVILESYSTYALSPKISRKIPYLNSQE